MSLPRTLASGTGLLEQVRAQRRVEAGAARATMQLVVSWAAAHRAPGLRDLPRQEVGYQRDRDGTVALT